jgi:DnaJ-domain-containing protein 1
MTSVEIFAILFFGVLGYMGVSHLLNRKAGAKQPSAGSASGSERGQSKNRGSAQDQTPPNEDPLRTLSWWEVLGTTPNASLDDIRHAYRVQVSRYHPDKVGHLGDEFKVIAERRAKEINAAYNEAMRVHGAAI